MKTVFDTWALTDKRLIARTATSDVFLVEQSNGVPAVLKLLSDVGKKDERQASKILAWYAGCGSVRLIRSNDDALLLEYAQGCELAGLVHAEEDRQATQIVCEVVRKLHAVRISETPAGLTGLKSRFADLYKEAGSTANPIVREAAGIADTLLQSTKIETALHGDIHHHNIIQSDRGWLAIDPKGLVGDPAYDLSNLFANPLDSEKLVVQAERTNMLIQTCADELGYCRKRIAQFAFVHNVLAAIWSGSIDKDDNVSLQVAQNIKTFFD